MAERVTTYQCPACTGPLHFDGKTGKLVCDYCGSSYSLDEVQAAYAGKNASAAAADKAAEEKEKKEAQAGGYPTGAREAQAAAASSTQFTQSTQSTQSWGADAARMRAYNCTTCGAELMCDQSTAALNCPYCGNPTIIPSRFDGVDRPDYVIPFKIEKKQAVDALKNYYKGKHLLPGSFAASNHLEEIKGVYVPFRLYSGTVDVDARYTAKKEHTERRGDTEIVRTEFYDVERSGAMDFDKIPVDASRKMPDDLMDSIEPYDYKDLRKFSLEYMPGYLANREDVPADDCRTRARTRAGHSAQDALKETVRDYTSVTTDRHNERFRDEKAEYALFPVWLLSTQWDGKNFLFAMNGQSGRMVGDLPVSKGKLYGFSGLTFAALFLLNYFLLFANHSQRMLMSILLPLIAALIVGFVLYGPMKNVAKRTTAGTYMEKRSLHLGRTNDRYVRTEETKRPVSSGKKPDGPVKTGTKPGNPGAGRPGGSIGNKPGNPGAGGRRPGGPKPGNPGAGRPGPGGIKSNAGRSGAGKR